MNKLLALIPVAFAIFALMVSPGIMSVYADPPTGKPQACENEQAQHVGNKHCDGAPTDPTQLGACDFDPIDGKITAAELSEYGTDNNTLNAVYDVNDANAWINQSDDNDNNEIDSSAELRNLNKALSNAGFTCPK